MNDFFYFFSFPSFTVHSGKLLASRTQGAGFSSLTLLGPLERRFYFGIFSVVVPCFRACWLPSFSLLPGSRFSPLGRLAAAGQSNAKAIPGAQERLSECSLSSSQKARKTTRRREKVQVPMARFLTPAIPGSVLFVRSSGSLFNYHGTLTSQVHGLQEEVIPRHCQPAGRSKVVSGGLWPC